ncbi:hypothetical protein PPYR_08822 [Photinus pyralis]|uniref:Pentraxin (PTX) domain-containing protein n=1 Tax=Photinus pyralis TaxID=7054 RepID=A0A5N4AKI7_PHOPY|nr:uncharacterized protein LOC116170365 [Photinus pyralis]KAB0797829.1 hypothetical protein PPYR_08822 [Photinus pyralis]
MSLISKITTTLIIIWGANVNSEIPSYKQTGIGIANSFHNTHPKFSDLINIVSLTQEGYIQFLRYIVDVPVIDEFTFCVWFRSINLTNAHPLLSYSEDEKTRYIRAWISPHGKEVNLAIMEKRVFTIESNFREKKWYHLCQSWESSKGYWGYFLNGKLVLANYESKLKGVQIPKGGDIVVGQEYTDFDKGLDDGIEGDIFGFNMVLSSAEKHPDLTNVLIPPYNTQRRVYNQNVRDPQNMHRYSDVPNVLSYFTVGPNRFPKGMWDNGKNLLNNFWNLFGSEERIRIKQPHMSEEHYRHPFETGILVGNEAASKRITSYGIMSDINGVSQKPLGLQLVELSYNCALRKGSPLDHQKMLISWTSTPVRVFGGAILKNIRPFCFKQNAG